MDSEGWVHCPICGNKSRTKVYPETVLIKFPLFCPKCGQTHIVGIQHNKIVSVEPDAKTQSR
ncbi:cysteine-rich KTR domain-containing protein [Faecalicatena contorta]|uniref:cysteine-rich KTR domain-containing protein n=1 Tax=Faecalicatena contorta TaxID=39482 RepID=UPI000D6A99AE|nr:cysteine-rich KTR domain-containing protein [Faecalicatena contorta]